MYEVHKVYKVCQVYKVLLSPTPKAPIQLQLALSVIRKCIAKSSIHYWETRKPFIFMALGTGGRDHAPQTSCLSLEAPGHSKSSKKKPKS